MSHAHFISEMCHNVFNYGVLGMHKATPTCRKHTLLSENLHGIIPTRDATIYRVSHHFKTISLYRYKAKPYRYIAYGDISTYRGLLTWLTIKL